MHANNDKVDEMWFVFHGLRMVPVLESLLGKQHMPIAGSIFNY